MKRYIAIFITVVSILTCLAVFAGCTNEGWRSAKEAFCNHKWHEMRRIEGNCGNPYDVVTYSCSKCTKEKTERISVSLQHDYKHVRNESAMDCQHQEWEVYRCTVCKAETIKVLDKYGPHVYDDNGKCILCGNEIG